MNLVLLNLKLKYEMKFSIFFYDTWIKLIGNMNDRMNEKMNKKIARKISKTKLDRKKNVDLNSLSRISTILLFY